MEHPDGLQSLKKAVPHRILSLEAALGSWGLGTPCDCALLIFLTPFAPLWNGDLCSYLVASSVLSSGTCWRRDIGCSAGAQAQSWRTQRSWVAS